MKRYLLFIVVAVLIFAVVWAFLPQTDSSAAPKATKTPTITPPPPQPWVLTWSDEFNGNDLDVTYWNRTEGPSPRNNEENYYTTDDVYVENGNLVLRQQLRDYGSGTYLRHYTSGQVISVYDIGPGTGKLEVRGKPTTSQGFHSAYWLCGLVTWPPEIDLLEVVGTKPYQAFMAWHYGTYPTDGGVSGTWDDPSGDLANAFHVYTVEYDYSRITWYIDGVQRYTTTSNLGQLATMPLKVWLDTAIGGDWEGDPDGTTAWPSFNLVDYVRVYQQGGTPITPTPRVPTATPTITPIPPATATPNGDPKLTIVSATASSEEGTTVVAAKAIDGSLTTRWGSLYSDPQWIYVDLGAVKGISRVILRWEAACGRNYDIQVSNDAANWTTVRSVILNEQLVNDLTGLEAGGRYVRMYGTARCLPYGYSLFEFEVYGSSVVPTPGPTLTPSNTPPPTNTPTVGPSPTPTNTPIATNTFTPTATQSNTNLALNKPATVSSLNGVGFEGTKAVDGNMTTYWRSEKRSSLPSQWITVDLGSSTTISRVELEWWSSGTVYGHATAYTIQVSQDNTNWTTVATVTGGNGSNDTISFTPVAARYVKMDSTAWSSTTEGCYLYEYEVYP